MKAKISWLAIIPDLCLMMIFIGFITIWKKIVTILTTSLEADNNRVTGKMGLLHTETMDSPIRQITSIKVEKSLFGNIFNYGNIYINTAGGNYIFKCISYPDVFKDFLLKKM